MKRLFTVMAVTAMSLVAINVASTPKTSAFDCESYRQYGQAAVGMCNTFGQLPYLIW